MLRQTARETFYLGLEILKISRILNTQIVKLCKNKLNNFYLLNFIYDYWDILGNLALFADPCLKSLNMRPSYATSDSPKKHLIVRYWSIDYLLANKMFLDCRMSQMADA